MARDARDAWFRGNPWIWLLLLGVLVLAGLVIYLAVAATGAEEEERAQREERTVTVTEPETVTEMAPEEEPATVTIPALVGLDYAEAHEQAAEAGLIADSRPVESEEPRGTVVAQSPEPGTEVATTRHVELAVSAGRGDRPLARIPDVTGPSAERAREIAIETGFTVRTVDRDAPTAEEVGEVILQRPDAGTSAPVLTQITLFVGR